MSYLIKGRSNLHYVEHFPLKVTNSHTCHVLTCFSHFMMTFLCLCVCVCKTMNLLYKFKLMRTAQMIHS